MKTLFIPLLFVFSLVQSAWAEDLVCLSEMDQSLYYSSGQVKVMAEVERATVLYQVALTTTGSSTLGLRPGRSNVAVRGTIRGNEARFTLGSDAWCSYRLTLPEDFISDTSFSAVLDASCEANTHAKINLNCTLK